MPHFRTAAFALICVAGAALAHGGVKNAAVKARMDLMVGVKEATAVLGGMAKGSLAFDAAQAETARAALEEYASQIAPLFRAEESDPKSEALPSIWTDWEGFTRAAEAMQIAASDMDASNMDGVRAGLGAIGRSCKACHQDYRIEK